MSRAAGYRTRQRELIVQFLKENSGRHLVAEDVAEHLRLAGTAVGKATVYRTLERLVEQNTVRKYRLGEGKSACYQYVGDSPDCQEHYHLKCEGCGKLLHVECEYLQDISEHVLTHHHFHVNGAKTVLYGLCDHCAVQGDPAGQTRGNEEKENEENR